MDIPTRDRPQVSDLLLASVNRVTVLWAMQQTWTLRFGLPLMNTMLNLHTCVVPHPTTCYKLHVAIFLISLSWSSRVYIPTLPPVFQDKPQNISEYHKSEPFGECLTFQYAKDIFPWTSL